MTMFGLSPADRPAGNPNQPDEDDDIFGPDPERLHATVTLWFVTTEHPGKVLRAEPAADRGFGRKLLAQLNPAWPAVTVIGQFPLNRSAPAARGEFYIAGYPGGVTVIQTVLDHVARLSQIDKRLLDAVPAADVYALARDPETGFGGLAHWRDGRLVRALSATAKELFEDQGLPEPFEAPFWAGERSEQHGGISLPFIPTELVDEAESRWLGVDISDEGPDLQVVAYAVDGRPAPKIDDPAALGGRARALRTEELAAAANSKLGISPLTAPYDDYEAAPESSAGDEFARLGQAAAAAARRVAREASHTARAWGKKLRERIKHFDKK